MTKPVIVTRIGKDSALTYLEQDTNFTNLRDATISLTAGTGGTQVISDLNGVITLVAGTGISLSGNNTAKTVTITGGNAFGNVVVGGTTVAADSPADTLTLIAGSNITLTPNATDDSVTITAGSVTSTFTSDLITVGDIGFPTIQTASTAHEVLNLVAGQNSDTIKSYIQLDSTTAGFIKIDSNIPNASVQLKAGALTGSNAGIVDALSPIRLPSMTTTQRDASSYFAANGTLIYNSTTNKFQGYANGTWVDLH